MSDIYETWYESYAIEGHSNVFFPTVSRENIAEAETCVMWTTLAVVNMDRDMICGVISPVNMLHPLR
jgi:hypothetical protein